MITLVDPTSTHQRFLLAAALRTQGPILELGCGWYSTPLLREIATAQRRLLYTLDSDEEWLNRFAANGWEGHYWHKRHHAFYGWDAVPWTDLGLERWGLVFVDVAPPLARGPLVAKLRDRADVFVLHDTEAPEAYGYALDFKHQVTDKAHWTWTTVASDTVDVTRWGLEQFPAEEQPRTFARYVMRVFPGSNHFFVEAGAHKGGEGSPTLELERAGWRGLCVEPSLFYDDLRRERRCAKSRHLLGEINDEERTFRQVLSSDDVELSGMPEHFSQEHAAAVERLVYRDVPMRTATLSTVLGCCGAPPRPEVLCLDTNGSEMAILRWHDFSRHRFQVVLVCYHGDADRRQELTELLESQGYQRSRGRGWDDGKNLTFVDRGVPG